MILDNDEQRSFLLEVLNTGAAIPMKEDVARLYLSVLGAIRAAPLKCDNCACACATAE